MSRWSSAIRLASSIVFAGLVASRLSVPEAFPLRELWYGIVVLAGVRGPWPNYTLVAFLRGKMKGSRVRLAVALAVDCVAIGLSIAFFDVPGPIFHVLGKILVAAIIAGAIPGWPDGGRQIARLLRFKSATREPASL